MSNLCGISAKQRFFYYIALIASLGMLHFGCRTPEPVIFERQKTFLADAFEAFKQSIQQVGNIPLDPSGIPDLKRLGVALPSTSNTSTVFWRKNLTANDLELVDGEYVIGMIADDIDQDLTYHVFLLYSNGMVVSSATSKQTVDKWAAKLRQQVNF